MPRSISVRRKYLPALSRDDSLPSSHRFTLGRRNPEGGGPAGKAARREEVVKVAEGHVLRAARTLARDEETGRARASAVRDLADAMAVGVNVWQAVAEKMHFSVAVVMQMPRYVIGWSGKMASAKCRCEKSELWTSSPKLNPRTRQPPHHSK